MEVCAPASASDEALHLDGPSPAAPPSAICPLCFEEDLSAAPSSAVTLSACRHRSCRACLARWVEREESSGQTTPPTCPFCRATIAEGDVLAILGRPFRPRLTKDDPSEGDEMDELTRHWLDENTVPCQACGSRIEKSDGCDLIECLCGYRFCYICGAPGGRCDCNPGHIFANDECSLNDYEHIPQTPIRDGNGRADLRACIRRTEVVAERELQRDKARIEEERRWDPSEEGGCCPSNGRWLFVPATDAGSVAILARQLGRDNVCRDRRTRRDGPREERRCASDGRWLFVPATNGWCVTMLAQRLDLTYISAAEEDTVPTVFRWEHGGRNVYITGTFNGWSRPIPMHRSGNDFTYIHNLTRGKHEFKFIVDDEWRFAPDQPTVADIEGRIFNFIDLTNFKAYTGDREFENENTSGTPTTAPAQPWPRRANRQSYWAQEEAELG